MSASMTPEQLVTAADHLLAAKMYSLASCVMLFYDIAITFGDEVEKIWKQRFTGATVLWFLNRYLSPLGYIVIIVSFQDPDWSKSVCQRYVLFPEVLKVFTCTAVGLIFILRLYSIYSKSKVVLYSFSALLICELTIKIWAFTDGVMLQLPPGFIGCILTGRSSPGDRIIYTWVAELVFDSAVFFATLYRTIQLYRRTVFEEALSLITVIMRDGIMYFAAIFVSNLLTVMIFIFAPDDLKVINASFSTLITSLMVSRLMLNLRNEVLKRGPVISSNHRMSSRANAEQHHLTSSQFTKSMPITGSRRELETGWSAFESSLVGNLGAPIMTFEADPDHDDYASDRKPSSDLYDPEAPGPHTPRSPHDYPPTPQSAHYIQTHSRMHSTGTTPPTPCTADAHETHRLRPSASAASSLSAASTSATLTALPAKARAKPRTRASKGSLRAALPRPRTRETHVEAMQTRSLPAPAIAVQVTEEVVVDESDDGHAYYSGAESVSGGMSGGMSGGGGMSPPPSAGAGSRPASAGNDAARGRMPPWLAPQSWRLSRDYGPEAAREPRSSEG